MSERHVVLRVGHGDRHAPTGIPRSRLIFTLDGEGDRPESDIKHKHLWRGLHDLGLVPSQAAIDLYRICAAAYCADLRLPRRNGYDQWTRQIVLHVPVADPPLWSAQVEPLTRLLNFLSGDKWRIQLREREVPAPAQKARRKRGDLATAEPRPLEAACLFSGGLDSFIGAAEAVAGGKSLLLMSHVPEGVSRWISPAQKALKEGLANEYEEVRIEHLKVTLNPPRSPKGTAKEPTQRARSILFLGFGTLAASAIGVSVPLIVPENGFISLNLPLTPGRIGSLSTRTTHPYALDLYRSVLAGLRIAVPVELPYMFATKGEMLNGATDPEVVHRLAPISVSCASPNPRSSSLLAHCGYCVPCIIRRAAMKGVGLDQAKKYRLNILRPGRDLTAAESANLKGFKIAVLARAGGVTLPELLAAGPLPSSIGLIADFESVHDRGLAEVAAFLGMKA